MAARILAQIIITGTQIVGKAFIEAYKQAATNSAKRGASNAAGQTGKPSTDKLTREMNMSFDEACQILNVRKDSDLKEIAKNFEHLFKINDGSQGGSFYLQSKVVRAKERIEAEKLEKEVGTKSHRPPPDEQPGGESGPSASA